MLHVATSVACFKMHPGTEPGRITLGFLLEVLCHTSCDSRSKNSLVAQTELLHLILLWSRENEVRCM